MITLIHIANIMLLSKYSGNLVDWNENAVS